MEALSKRALRFKALTDTINAVKKRIHDTGLKLPSFVKVVEVGPRDGLQNEKTIVPTKDKIAFINKLSDSGLKIIETTSFVSPKWVPQMGDNVEVFTGMIKKPGVSQTTLVPNIKGLETAIKTGVKEIAVFGAASEGFTKANINCTIEESLHKFKEVIDKAKEHNIKVRGYVSCVMGCPYEGEINPHKVAVVSQKLFDMGCQEISLGDTIGVGTPEKTEAMLRAIKDIPMHNLAVHFHDTYDKAIPNILKALEMGVSVVDSSVGGLGGCPYAKKAAGNVCTENVVYALHQLGINTGIDLGELIKVGSWITQLLGKENLSAIE